MTEHDISDLSDAELERLANRISAEQDRRWRKQEKQAVKDAMKIPTAEETAAFMSENAELPPEAKRMLDLERMGWIR